MSLLRRGDDTPGGRRFQMREKLASIGDDAWIEDDHGDRVFKVDGKALRIRDTFILEERDGHEVAELQERKLRVRGTMEIERDGRTVATVHKALVGFRDRFKIDVEGGEDLDAHGNIVDHEYEIKRGGDVVATISKKWLRVRDTYGRERVGVVDEQRVDRSHGPRSTSCSGRRNVSCRTLMGPRLGHERPKPDLGPGEGSAKVSRKPADAGASGGVARPGLRTGDTTIFRRGTGYLPR